jgi:hypothetical protein
MLTPITRYSLANHEGEYNDWPLTTLLIIDGVPSTYRVPGYVLDAQYQWNDNVVLITSWDCPFEESYDFLLLDREHTIVSRKSLGAPYGTYLLHGEWPHDDLSIRLHFYEHRFYTLSIRQPTGMFRRKLSLHLQHHLLTPPDERTQTSVRELDRLLQEHDARQEGGD